MLRLAASLGVVLLGENTSAKDTDELEFRGVRLQPDKSAMLLAAKMSTVFMGGVLAKSL